MERWYHDKRAGFIKPEGGGRYICRGFAPEHGKLIAAAPDLLDALKDCDDAFAMWQVGQIPGRPEDILALIAKLRAAIAKAEGLPVGRS